MKRILYILALLQWALPLRSEPMQQSDTTSNRGNIIVRTMNFFDRVGEDETFTKSVDWGVLGGIGYSQEKGLGVSANLTGAYRTERTDKSSPPSWFTLMASAALNDYYCVETAGVMYLNSERHQIDHFVEYSSGRRNIWGIGYDAALYNDPIYYRLNTLISNIKYRYQPVENLYIGGVIDYQHYRGFDITDPCYIDFEQTKLQMGGVGVHIEYDSRDDKHSATKGLYASLQGVSYPKGLNNIGSSFYKSLFTFATYHPLWRGGVIAGAIQGEFSSQGTPWAMLPSLGDYNFMRGYYIGRFVDNNAVSLQVELRQQIWWRFSGAVWGGCGNMYSTPRDFDLSQTLPTYGIGGRFRASKSAIARLDLGFGRDTIGVFLRYSEAF